jgi:hypothetical protein
VTFITNTNYPNATFSKQVNIWMRWQGERNSYKILVTKHERKRPLGRPMHRWEDNIKMGLKVTRCKDMESIYLAQDRVH